MIKANFKVLFHLENEQIEIVEIKRNGILSDDKSKIYHWLLYDRKNDMLTHLVFKSMRNETGKEHRIFEDSTLVFDTKQGQFKERREIHNLKVLDADIVLSQKLKEAIGDYILLLNFKM